MRNTSISLFERELTSMFLTFNRNPPSIQLVQVWQSRLIDYKFESVRQALINAANSGVSGDHPPNLNQVISFIPESGDKITKEYLMDQLLNPTSSIGVLFKAKVGSTNIRMMGDHAYDRIIDVELRKFMGQVPDLIQRFVYGEGFSERAIVVLMRPEYQHINLQEFAGCNISPEITAKNRQRCIEVRERGKFLIEDNSTEPMDKKAVAAPEVAKFIQEIMGGIEPKAPATPEAKLCNKCVQEYNPELNECPNCQTERN